MSPVTVLPRAMAAPASTALSPVLPAQGGVIADFSQETWWLTLIKAVFIVAFLIVSVIIMLWVERRGLARMQTRPGPNVNGPFGLFQAIADATFLMNIIEETLRFSQKKGVAKAEGMLYSLLNNAI